MAHLPPHLESDAEVFQEDFIDSKTNKVGPQGKSKYGKGGSRLYKAKGRAARM